MSSVQRITIRNFQSHAHTVIEPAPAGGLTVLTGESDAGKTAILRALRWGYYNQPQGDEFRRIGCDFVEAELETDAGTVVRRRTATTNRYIVNGEVFEGFGSEVPLEVQQVTGVRPVRLGDQLITANLARQLDAPFLGSSISGPARAKVLGKLAGTEVIDRAARDVGTDLYRVRQEVRRLEDEVTGLEEQIGRYDHLPQLAEQIERLRQSYDAIKALQARLARLSPLQARLRVIAGSRRELLSTLSRLGDVEAADAACRQAERAHDRAESLTVLQAQLTRVDERRQKGREYIRGLGDVDRATEAMQQAAALHQRRTRLQGLRRRATSINNGRKQCMVTIGTLAGLDQAAAAWEAAVQVRQRLERLTVIRSRLSALGSEHEQQSRILAATLAVCAHEDTVASAEELAARRDKLAGVRARLIRIHADREQAGMARIQASYQYDVARMKYAEALVEAGRCPTCGGDIDHNHIMEVTAS